jgi:hypothetical protein
MAIEPRADKIYHPVQRGLNRWLFLTLLIGGISLILIGLAVLDLVSFLATALLIHYDFIRWVGLFVFYIGVLQLFIHVLAHVGMLRT